MAGFSRLCLFVYYTIIYTFYETLFTLNINLFYKLTDSAGMRGFAIFGIKSVTISSQSGLIKEGTVVTSLIKRSTISKLISFLKSVQFWRCGKWNITYGVPQT